MAKIQELVERVMTNYYSNHEQGEQLLIIDLEALVDEGYLVPAGESPYGVLRDEAENLRDEVRELKAEVEDLEDVITELENMIEN